MLTLLINRQAVNLPEDFSFEIHRENPLFFRSSDYTYDIELSLLDPTNAQLYDHIDRLQHITSFSSRSAMLLEDGNVLLNGTETVLEKTDTTVKIQIVAGNAELNYLTGDDTLIRSLDFGTIDTPTTTVAANVAPYYFPTTNYVFPPTLKNYNISDNGRSDIINSISNGTAGELAYDEDTELHPMPFFLYILEKFVTLMGYTLTSNPFRNEDRWKRLLIIHGYDTLEYAKMLPNWTTAKFVEEVEKFLNCIFIVDNMTKECQLISIPDFYEDKPVAYIDNILDDFDIAFNADDDELFISYDNLSYDLPSSDYWKYARLPEEVKELCTISSGRTSDITPSADNVDDFTIYLDSSHLLYFICRDTELDNAYRYIFQEVDQFRDYIKDESLDTVELSIVPCEIHAHIPHVDNFIPYSEYSLLPYPVFYEKTESVGIHEAITNGISDNASDIMQVAFYTGVVPMYTSDASLSNTFEVPMCFTNHCCINDSTLTFTVPESSVTGSTYMNLSFQGTYGRVAMDFQTDYSIDTSHKRTIRFVSDEYIDPVSIFQIQNKRYACRELKYTFKNGQRSNIVEGIFYPIS